MELRSGIRVTRMAQLVSHDDPTPPSSTGNGSTLGAAGAMAGAHGPGPLMALTCRGSCRMDSFPECREERTDVKTQSSCKQQAVEETVGSHRLRPIGSECARSTPKWPGAGR